MHEAHWTGHVHRVLDRRERLERWDRLDHRWTCEVLSASALRRLQQSTRHAIALANTTM
jgi:hypothetical protein